MIGLVLEALFVEFSLNALVNKWRRAVEADVRFVPLRIMLMNACLTNEFLEMLILFLIGFYELESYMQAVMAKCKPAVLHLITVYLYHPYWLEFQDLNPQVVCECVSKQAHTWACSYFSLWPFVSNHSSPLALSCLTKEPVWTGSSAVFMLLDNGCATSAAYFKQCQDPSLVSAPIVMRCVLFPTRQKYIS